MAFRFRKTVRLAPGLRINIAKKGASLSVGGKGLTYNIGGKGTRSTLGIPGSGASWSTYRRHSGGFALVIIIALIVLVIYLLR